MRPAVDRAVGRGSSAVRVAVGNARVRRHQRVGRGGGGGLHDEPADRPRVQRRQSAEVRKLVAERMLEMPPTRLLRDAAHRVKEDEWLLYLHGAVLGFGAGAGAPGDLRSESMTSCRARACANHGRRSLATPAGLPEPGCASVRMARAPRRASRSAELFRTRVRAARPRPAAARHPRHGHERRGEAGPRRRQVDAARSWRRAAAPVRGRPLRGGRAPRLRAHPLRDRARRGPHPAPVGARGPPAGGRRAQRAARAQRDLRARGARPVDDRRRGRLPVCWTACRPTSTTSTGSGWSGSRASPSRTRSSIRCSRRSRT